MERGITRRVKLQRTMEGGNGARSAELRAG